MATGVSAEQESELGQEEMGATCDLKCKYDGQFIEFLNALFGRQSTLESARHLDPRV
jgi:hypothetical protein